MGSRPSSSQPGAGGANRPRLPVYLDYQATTPVDPRALEAMLPYFSETFGNPHSIQHRHGLAAERAVEEARERVAGLIGAEAREIIFTSGATESNNLAIKGAARFFKGRKSHIVTCVTEHKCVLESCRAMEEEGFRVTVLPVGADGLVDVERLKEALTDETCLVSIMTVNNEIGVVQPVERIGALCRERGIYFHSDAAQAVAKIPVDVGAMGVDFLSISGHKIYGPKGIGVLYVRRRPRARLVPLMSGGGQERGLRSGTLPAPLCVGLGAACAIAGDEMDSEAERLRGLSRRLREHITSRLPGVRLNGDGERRVPGNLNFSFEGVDGQALLDDLVDDISVSSGSACTSTSVEPSYVLRALGLSDALAHASIRIGLGRFTTVEEVDYAAERIVETVTRLREGIPASRAAP